MLEVAPRVDAPRDAESLRLRAVLAKVKAQKYQELAKSGDHVESLSDVTVSAEEYPRYLKMAYKEEPFPKPRTFLGLLKELPVSEMEKLLLTHVVITEGDLQQLAAKRAQAVRDYLTKPGLVEPSRVFLATNAVSHNDQSAGVKESRVDLAIRS